MLTAGQRMRVILTQPQPRAAGLAQVLAASGHDVSTLGFARVELQLSDPKVRRHLEKLDESDWILPVSPSAIDALAAWLLIHPMTLGARVALIGPGSLEHWQQAFELPHFDPGSGPPLLPRHGEFDAAALIAEPELQEIAGQRLTIIQSASRPPPWAGQLQQRGARVDCVAAYRVLDVTPSAEESLQFLEVLANVRDGRGGLAISVTSVTLAQALTVWLERAVPAEWQPVLAHCHWLANHPRVADSLNRAGYTKVLTVRPGESGLLQALESLS